MGKFSKAGGREMPELNTSSLPDLVFAFLFFIKADQETKMGLITDVKQALREAYALKISYSARQAAD